MNSHLNTDYAQNIQPLSTKIYDVLGWEYNEHGQHGFGFMERFKTYDDMCRQVERQQRQGGWKSSLLGLGRSWI